MASTVVNLICLLIVVKKREKLQLSESIKNVIAIYTQRGFKVEHALLDGEFVPLRTELLTASDVICAEKFMDKTYMF